MMFCHVVDGIDHVMLLMVLIMRDVVDSDDHHDNIYNVSMLIVTFLNRTFEPRKSAYLYEPV